MAQNPPKTGTEGSTRPPWTTGHGPRASSRGKVAETGSNWRDNHRRRGLKFDEDQKKIFLDSLEATGMKQRSYDAADVTRNCVMSHIDKDPEFAAKVDQAIDNYREHVRQAVYDRGVRGWEEPVYGGGKRVLEPIVNEDGEVLYDEAGNQRMKLAYVLKRSDRLLELEAKRVDPAYRDKGLLEGMEGNGIKKIVVEFVDPEPVPEIKTIENDLAPVVPSLEDQT